MFAGFVIGEAIASTAMSHPQDQEHRESCDICRAAAGDMEAFARVMFEVEREFDSRGRP